MSKLRVPPFRTNPTIPLPLLVSVVPSRFATMTGAIKLVTPMESASAKAVPPGDSACPLFNANATLGVVTLKLLTFKVAKFVNVP